MFVSKFLILPQILAKIVITSLPIIILHLPEDTLQEVVIGIFMFGLIMNINKDSDCTGLVSGIITNVGLDLNMMMFRLAGTLRTRAFTLRRI